MSDEQGFLIESLTEKLVFLMMQEHNLTMLEAMDKVYNSKHFDKIMDLETGLYCQSALYNFQYYLSTNPQ